MIHVYISMIYILSSVYRRGGVGVGKKADVEMSQTYAWIQTHLEEDVTVSLPKQEVYEDYRSFCVGSKFEPMCVADFGKAMKHIFPGVKPRRLGQRGNSKYCYSGLKKRVHVETPELPPMDLRKGSNGVKKSSSEDDMWMRIVLTWAEKLTETRFSNISDLASFLVRTQRIDPDHLDASLLKNVSLTGKKNAPGSGSRCSSQEPSRKKRSASSSSCPKTTDLRDGFNASSVPDDKVGCSLSLSLSLYSNTFHSCTSLPGLHSKVKQPATTKDERVSSTTSTSIPDSGSFQEFGQTV